jgi:hypothetical protein
MFLIQCWVACALEANIFSQFNWGGNNGLDFQIHLGRLRLQLLHLHSYCLLLNIRVGVHSIDTVSMQEVHSQVYSTLRHHAITNDLHFNPPFHSEDPAVVPLWFEQYPFGMLEYGNIKAVQIRRLKPSCLGPTEFTLQALRNLGLKVTNPFDLPGANGL